MPTTLRTRSENGVWYIRRTPAAARHRCPLDTSIKSAPPDLSAAATATSLLPISHAPPSRRPTPAPRSAARPAMQRARPRAPRAGTANGPHVPAVGVGSPVGERREEARQQIAVRHVQLEHVESGRRAALRGGRECRGHSSMSARDISRELDSRRPCTGSGEADSTGQLPAASGCDVSHPSCVEPLRPEWPSCQADLRPRFPVHEIDDALPRSRCGSFHRPVHPE